jgi:hypothetical protein
MNKKLLAVVVITILLLAVVGSVAAQENSIFTLIFTRLPESEQGPDEIFTIDQYGLVCIYKNGALDCECPCIDGCQDVEPAVSIPQEPTEAEAPATSVPTNPVPTNTPKPSHVLITHYDGQGRWSWTRCMPISSVKGHEHHVGHPIQDIIGEACP